MNRPGQDGPRRDPKKWRSAWDTASVGIEVALCIVAGFLGGRWLDDRFGTYPWLMLIGFAAGAAAAGRALWRVVKREIGDSDQNGEDR